MRTALITRASCQGRSLPLESRAVSINMAKPPWWSWMMWQPGMMSRHGWTWVACGRGWSFWSGVSCFEDFEERGVWGWRYICHHQSIKCILKSLSLGPVLLTLEVGITSEFCGKRRCKDWLDFRFNCSNRHLASVVNIRLVCSEYQVGLLTLECLESRTSLLPTLQTYNDFSWWFQSMISVGSS